jgi:hypothetical protein
MGMPLEPVPVSQGVRDGRANTCEVILSSLAEDIPLIGMDVLLFIVSGYDDTRRLQKVGSPPVELKNIQSHEGRESDRQSEDLLPANGVAVAQSGPLMRQYPGHIGEKCHTNG